MNSIDSAALLLKLEYICRLRTGKKLLLFIIIIIIITIIISRPFIRIFRHQLFMDATFLKVVTG